MTYYKVRIEGWLERDPSKMELSDIAYEMTEGIGYCTSQRTIKTIEELSKIEEDCAREFFGYP